MNTQDGVSNTLALLAASENQKTFVQNVLGEETPEQVNAATINRVRKTLESYFKQHLGEIAKADLTSLFCLKKKLTLLTIKGDFSPWFISSKLVSLSATLTAMIDKFNKLPFDPFPSDVLVIIVEYLFSEERHQLNALSSELPLPAVPVPVRLFFEAVSQQQIEEFVSHSIHHYREDPSIALEIQQFFRYTCFDQQKFFFDTIRLLSPPRHEAFIHFTFKMISPRTLKLHLPTMRTAWMQFLPSLLQRLQHLQALKISGKYAGSIIKMLQARKQWKDLKKLKLSFPCDDATAISIAKMDLPNLEALQLDYTHHVIHDRGLNILLSSHNVKNLSHLNLAHSFFLSSRILTLLTKTDLPCLTNLNLRECRSIDDFSILFKSKIMHTLKKLDVSHSKVTDTALFALAENRNKIALESLCLAYTKVTNVGLMALVKSIHAKSLKEVTLEAPKIRRFRNGHSGVAVSLPFIFNPV